MTVLEWLGHLVDYRAVEYNGMVFVVRDRATWVKGDPLRCEYATLEGDQVVWTPCVEGVTYANIKPLLHLTRFRIEAAA